MDRDYVSPVHTFAELLKLHERVAKLEALVAEKLEALVADMSPKATAKPMAEPVSPAKPAKKG